MTKMFSLPPLARPAYPSPPGGGLSFTELAPPKYLDLAQSTAPRGPRNPDTARGHSESDFPELDRVHKAEIYPWTGFTGGKWIFYCFERSENDSIE